MTISQGSVLQRDTLGDYPTGKSRRFQIVACPAPFAKIFLFFGTPKSVYAPAIPSLRGALAIVTNVGRDAVDAGGAKDEGVILRTAKACGPDLSTLRSSLR
jgi:hypothetical protein